MRITTQNTTLWRKGGIAATDAASLVGCAIREEENPLVLWSNKIWMRERSLRKQLLEQGTTEWLEWRNKGVGASEVASVVGAAWAGKVNAKDLWKTKTQVSSGEAENENMKRGKDNEPIARQLYEALYDWPVPACCVLHDEHDFVRASLDGLRPDDKLIVEIKCCGRKNHEKLLEVQSISDPLLRQQAFSVYFNYYRYQVLYQLLITQAEVCHFVGYCKEFTNHNKLAVIELYPEPAEQEKLLNRVIEFWRYVEERNPPPTTFCVPCHSPPRELSVS